MCYIKFENVTNNIFKGINLEVKKGDFIIITGLNKSGKTSLLNAICGIDDITSGNIIVDNKIINELSERKLTKYRRDVISFVFEEPIFLENLTIIENIKLANQVSKNKTNVFDIIKKVGLLNKEHYYPYELSKSEKQLLSIAMALTKKTNILLCDEPFSNLDSSSKKEIIKLFDELCKNEKTTIILTSKSDNIPLDYKKIINIKNGNLAPKKNTKKKANGEKK